jgi:hypothetical protein
LTNLLGADPRSPTRDAVRSGPTEVRSARITGAHANRIFSMIQTPVAVPIQRRPNHDGPESTPVEALLRLAGELKGTSALIVADHSLDLMCGLIRRGCLSATALRIGDRPDTGDCDLVLVPNPNMFASPDDVIRLARRSLGPNGRLIAGVTAGSAAGALARRLRLNGFTALRSVHLPGVMLLRADLRRHS